MRILRNRAVRNIGFISVIVCLLFIGVFTATANSTPNSFKSDTWHNIQLFLHSKECAGSHKHHDYRCGNVFRKSGRQMWDGKYSYSERSEYCVELFNPSNRPAYANPRPLGLWDDTLPGGGYLKVCQDSPSDYHYHDGNNFKHMETY